MNQKHFLHSPLETSQESSCKHSAAVAVQTGVLCVGLAIAAAAVANAVIAWNTPSAGPRLNGGFNRVPLRYGDAAYFVSGKGSPLLLLHAPRAGNSSAEWEANFEALAQQHTVYAFDFLGWGLSDKPGQLFTPSDYAEQIEHFIADIIGEPCAVIASGEAANFALLTAQHAPELISKLVLICPQTIEESPALEGEEEMSPENGNWLYRVLSLPIIGQAVSNWQTSRAQLELQAKQNLYFDKTHVTPGVVSRLHVASHQPASHRALAAQSAGLLQTDWRTAWSNLHAPALLVWGRNAPQPGIETAPEWLALNPEARLEVFDEALLLPHAEHADDFNARVLKWLA